MLADLLLIREPKKKIQVINRGISGHTVDDLRARWSDHVLAFRPDQLVVKIGINDINRWVSNPEQNPKQSPQEFASIYEQVIALTRAELPQCKVLLVSPFYASKEKQPNAYRSQVLGVIPGYVSNIKKIAEQHQTAFLDLHDAVQALLTAGLLADSFAEDAVHPSPAGALFIAEQIYQSLAKS